MYIHLRSNLASSLRLTLGLIAYFGEKRKKNPEHYSKEIILCLLKTVDLWVSLEYFKTDANSD